MRLFDPSLRWILALGLVGSGLWGCRDPAPDEVMSATHGDDPSGSGSGPSAEPAPEIPEGCGNGRVEAGEACDLGFANAEDGACTPACGWPRCGDGFLAPDEDCDLGSANGGPDCTEACRIPSRLSWSAILSGSAHAQDQGFALAPMSDGGVVMVSDQRGEPVELVLDRYAADGTHLWTQVLDSTLRRNGRDAALVPTEDDGVLLAVHAEAFEGGGDDRVELRSLDPQGRPRWVYEVSTTAEGAPIRGTLARSGQEIVLSLSILPDEEPSFSRIVRFDPGGEVQSEREIEPNLLRLVAGPEGGFYAFADDQLMAFDGADQLRWAQDLNQLTPGELAVDSRWRVAATYRDPTGVRELRLFDRDGEPVWTAPLGTFSRGVAAGPDDVFAVVGTLDAEADELSTNTKIGVELFDQDGARLWIAGADGPGHGEDDGHGVAITGDGAVWACGDVQVPFEELDVWIGRFDGGAP